MTPAIPPQRLSALLSDLAARGGEGPNVSLGDLLDALKGRAFGALFLVFAFPNVLPSPPGLAGVLGVPLLFLSFQMMMGRSPWLPQVIARRSLSRESFRGLVAKVEPWLQRAERLLGQRLMFLTSGPAQRLLGGVVLVLAIALSLPIPFANMAPALAICVIGLGVLERDGLWILAGLIGGAAALVYVAVMGYAVVASALFLVMNAF